MTEPMRISSFSSTASVRTALPFFFLLSFFLVFSFQDEGEFFFSLVNLFFFLFQNEFVCYSIGNLGDTHVAFSKLGRSFKLPQTATLALRAPEQCVTSITPYKA
jgi:hypothetical protein